MKSKYLNQSSYLNSADSLHVSQMLVRSTLFRRTGVLFITIFMASLLVFSVFSSSVAVAFADDDPKETLQENADDYNDGEGVGEGSEGFAETLEGIESNPDRNNFGYVLNRVFGISYINRVAPDTVGSGGAEAPDNGLLCNADDPAAGTLVYHNCDVPNLATEFVQDVAALFAVSGAQNAEVDIATIENQWFGLPSTIPGEDGSVPVRASERQLKYTGLELFGYNLKYTVYAGEWDHIKVMTQARALSNFGFMDSFKLGAKSIVNGISAGVSQGTSNAVDELQDGDIIGAIGGGWSGFWGGGASAAANTIIDSSDMNIFTTYGWYRTGFGSTVYGARELSTEEQSVVMQQNLKAAITGEEPDAGKVPIDLKVIEKVLEKPDDNIASCTYNDANGDSQTLDSDNPTGPTESECETEAKRANPDDEDPAYEWDEDGKQKKETLRQWKKDNSKAFEIARKYDIDCNVNVNNESNRTDEIANFRSCWPDAWDKAAATYQKENASGPNSEDWIKDTITGENLQKSMQNNPRLNSNAPFNRYICVDNSGRDIKGSNRILPGLPVYEEDGSSAGNCDGVRPPIQDGFFGNGYLENQDQPGPDTRRERFDASIFSIFFPVDVIANNFSNAGLGVAVFATRISNTLLNLAFSPILDTLGLNSIVAELIGDFKDSIFMPFAIFVIAIGALMVLVRTGRMSPLQQLKTLGLMCLTFIIGVMLIAFPEKTVNFVDEGPAYIEAEVMGAVFGTNNDADDELCTATGTADVDAMEGIDGSPLDTDPQSMTRTMMCENWRVFAFNPWVYGQYGTSFDHLYAANSGEPNRFENTNGDLVGNASVQMGNNTDVNNWALYQLRTTSSGTATDRDPQRPTGFVDPQFYRMVDIQAGPENGEGTDDRYFNMWSGAQYSDRMVIGGLSSAVSIVGLITVALYSIAKIQIAFVSVIILIFLPIMLLIGLFPYVGAPRLRAYVETILALIIQRIVLVTMLAVMIRVVTDVANSGQGYVTVAIATIAICGVFIYLRKPMMKIIMDTIGRSDAPFGGAFTEQPLQKMKHNTPKFMKGRVGLAKAGVGGAAAGAIGGFMVNGRQGIVSGAKDQARIESNRAYVAQRSAGFGVSQTMSHGSAAGKASAVKDLKQVENKTRIQDNLNQNLQKNLEEKGHSSPKSFGNEAFKSNRGKDHRNLRKMDELASKMDNVGDRKVSKEDSKVMESPDIEAVKARQDRVIQENSEKIEKYKNYQDEYNKIADELAEDEAKRIMRKEKREEMKNDLLNLRENFTKSSDEVKDKDPGRGEKGKGD